MRPDGEEHSFLDRVSEGGIDRFGAIGVREQLRNVAVADVEQRAAAERAQLVARLDRLQEQLTEAVAARQAAQEHADRAAEQARQAEERVERLSAELARVSAERDRLLRR